MKEKREKFQLATKGKEGFRNSDRLLNATRYAPGLIVHESLSGNKARVTVAHEHSGYSIVRDIRKTAARYIAGALSGLPVDWDAKTKADFMRQFDWLPNNVKELVHILRKAA